jgi:hypothetical protein
MMMRHGFMPIRHEAVPRRHANRPLLREFYVICFTQGCFPVAGGRETRDDRSSFNPAVD